MSTLTTKQLKHVLNGLHAQAQETKHYLASYEDAEVPSEMDTCCSAHFLRFDQRRAQRRSLAARLEETQALIELFEAHDGEFDLETPPSNGPDHAPDVIDLKGLTLVYRGAKGGTHEQPLVDLSDAGTLVDPGSGDDLELVAARLTSAVASLPDVPAAPASEEDDDEPLFPLVAEIAAALQDRGDERAADWILGHQVDVTLLDLLDDLLEKIRNLAAGNPADARQA